MEGFFIRGKDFTDVITDTNLVDVNVIRLEDSIIFERTVTTPLNFRNLPLRYIQYGATATLNGSIRMGSMKKDRIDFGISATLQQNFLRNYSHLCTCYITKYCVSEIHSQVLGI